jgi:hypothetical protein
MTFLPGTGRGTAHRVAEGAVALTPPSHRHATTSVTCGARASHAGEET